MKTTRAFVVLVLVIAALWHASDGQPQRPLADQLRLAGALPRGALVYVQARDLSALMKAWMASTVRNKFYASPSYTAFSKSRVFLKFQDRRGDFEKALGFGIDEDRLTELAGGASAVAVYDIGKLDMAFVTELPRERALLTTMFKRLPQFQERNADGGIYYAKDVQTDGGRLSQQFCFAHVGGKLIVTTSEGLMIRALAAVKTNGADSLLGDVMALAEQAKGFATHDLTIWLDQARLNRDRLFNSYWIHQNVGKELNGIESGLLDLRITAQGLTEQRYFKLAAGGRGPGAGSQADGEAGSLKGSDAAALLKFAPADAQLAEIHPQVKAEDLADTVTSALFGHLPTAEPTRPDVSRPSSSDDDSGGRTERYSQLDARFDVDVDDEQAPPRGNAPARKGKAEAAPQTGPTSFVAAMTRLAPVAVCELTRSKADPDRPFVHFERAVVVEMKSEAAIDRAALERAIVEEMRARFVVAGVDPRFTWQDDAGVRVLGQSLLEKGAAYTVTGKYLVLASSKQFAADIAQAAAATAEAPRIDGTVSFYALVRVSEAKPVFDKLMAKLDGKVTAPPAPKVKKADQEEEESADDSASEVKFFSDNVSSLVSATTIRDMRLRRESSGQIISERLVYSF
ncbi:MAG TPA: hypothetical protein VJ464_27105 [Blastocatellia bacterium]|nr:hypothetical protein [Blastocatellia bacterium]